MIYNGQTGFTYEDGISWYVTDHQGTTFMLTDESGAILWEDATNPSASQSAVGRFASEDPARDGVNWYSYVGNNPLRYIDPTGLMQIEGTEKEDSDVTQEKERKRRARRERRRRDRDKEPNRPSDAELQAQREFEWQRQMDEWDADNPDQLTDEQIGGVFKDLFFGDLIFCSSNDIIRP